MQFTSINGHSSIKLSVSCGIPQGSVLVPLLFLLYINDLPNSVSGERVKLFADDTNLFISSSTISELEQKANHQILNINKWLIANRLHLNTQKTCYSVFSPNKSVLSTISVKINNSVINRVNNCKYLGIIIDDQLKWSTHIKIGEQKLKHLVGILYKIRYKLSDWWLRNIYFAFVHPYILHGLELYGNTLASYLDKLTTLNNKILRILQKKRTVL